MIWQRGYYYRSSPGPLPTLSAPPPSEESSVRRGGVQSLLVWSKWRKPSWFCEPPDSQVYCLEKGKFREKQSKNTQWIPFNNKLVNLKVVSPKQCMNKTHRVYICCVPPWFRGIYSETLSFCNEMRIIFLHAALHLPSVSQVNPVTQGLRLRNPTTRKITKRLWWSCLARTSRQNKDLMCSMANDAWTTHEL